MLFKENKDKPWMLYLTDIRRDDIRFANLAGRPTESKYPNQSNTPEHVYVVWLDRQELVDEFLKRGVTVSEQYNEETGESRYSVRFKANPKLKYNRKTGRDEPSPKIFIKDGFDARAVRLDISNFGLVDSAKVESVDIRFHLYNYKPGNYNSCWIDELCCIADPNSGYIDDTYLAEKNGYLEEDRAEDNVFIDADDEEVPFS